MKKNKPNLTGLLFGSFNPVHIGHIAIAGYMKEFEGLDEVWFIVSPRNPFKSLVHLAKAEERLEMVRMAAKKHKGLIASDIEFGMPLPSYTIDTMKKLTGDFPEREFKIIIGSDNLESIPLWKRRQNPDERLQFPDLSQAG
jgi:nicotinate-nucleotide adenylyltransferase